MSTPKNEQEKLWTPANVVTLVRICLIPLFVVAILSPWPTWISIWPDAEIWKEWIAAGIFILLAATDALDGYLARSRNEITNFGKFMDPLADKILVAAALLSLIELGVLPSWVALIILCREFIVSGIRMVAATKGIVIAASWYGKAKTVAQIIAIVLFIVKDNHMVSTFSEVIADRLYLFSWAVMIVALILTIVSMLDYFAKTRVAFRLDREQDISDLLSTTSIFDEELLQQAREILDQAISNKMTLGFAESCTGGMVSALFTELAGSSAAIEGGIVSYSNKVKQSVLQVDADTLATYGAVSEQTACQMAEGARKMLSVDVAFSVTGVAGPDGGSAKKPIGTVWVGWSTEHTTAATVFHFSGSREDIRLATVHEVLNKAQQLLKI